MKNDRGLGANVQSGLSERSKITESPKDCGMAHTNERTNKPMGGSPSSKKGSKGGSSY